jgi:hypothetical protein
VIHRSPAQARRRRLSLSRCLNASTEAAWPLRVGEAVLDAMSINHLAHNHLEVPLLPPVPAAHIVAVEPNHDGSGRRCRGPLRDCGRVRLHDLLAHSPRIVSCPACPNSIPNPEHVRNSLSWQDATLAKLRLNVTETGRDGVDFAL